MNHSPERRAVVTTILGGIAVLLGCIPQGFAKGGGLLLGIFTLVRGARLVVSVARSKPSSPKRVIVMSFLGCSLGALAILLGTSRPVRRSVMDVNRHRWEQGRSIEGQEANNPGQRQALVATNFTSNLPIIVVHANGRSIPSYRSAVVRAQFFDVDSVTRRASLGGNPAHDGQVQIHVRGSSSQRLPKSSYTLHTVEHGTNQVKVPLLGMPKEEDWVLYAPFEDKTMIRDVLAYELARRTGHYAPRTRFVEVFITSSPNGLSMDDYAGVYVLMEKIKRGPNRVNIAKLEGQSAEAPEISGGYIVKRDHKERGEPQFSTSQGGPYFFVYPDARKITRAQRAWLINYFNEFEMALHGPEFTDPNKGYAAYLDVDSFIDAHWLIEMSKNVDGFRYSAFLTKDRDGKLKTEPPWDWNRSFGNANYYGGWQPDGWYWARLRPNEISWYHRLREDPEFTRRCNARWAELRTEAFDPPKILQLVDSLAAQLEEAQVRNFERWPILGEHVTCNYYVGSTYAEEIAWLKTWIVKRVGWIDRQVGIKPNSNKRGRNTEGDP